MIFYIFDRRKKNVIFVYLTFDFCWHHSSDMEDIYRSVSKKINIFMYFTLKMIVNIEKYTRH